MMLSYFAFLSLAAAPSIPSDQWFAWNNRRPSIKPGEVRFCVVGKVRAPVGYEPVLEMVKPQGINHKILILGLSYRKLPPGVKSKRIYTIRWAPKVIREEKSILRRFQSYTSVRIRYPAFSRKVVKVKVKYVW